ncbi:MAG: peptidoglycan editing factor PgeF [Pseudomonadota bacterium]|nr:peptidoglycan editing factor PgeF [Pseudomonadota bacterium]
MLQAPTLSASHGIRHAFFTRAGGVSEGVYASLNGGIGSHDEAANVAENRARMARTLEISPENLVTAYQIHSPDVVIAEQSWNANMRPHADAIVTRIPRLGIGVTTADCGPVLFAEAQAGVVGAAHAGWRGALSGVIEATIGGMEKLGANRARIVAAIGPMIRQPNYEVGAELVEKFLGDNHGNARFFAPAQRDGHAMFDLAAYVAARLASAGIRQIEDLDRCTYSDPSHFFSYRRSQHRGETDYGRHVNAIALMD